MPQSPNLIPLSRRLAADTLTPVGLLLAARRAGHRGFLLESVEGGRHLARYSFLGFQPRERLLLRQGQVLSLRNGVETVLPGSLPEAMKARLAAVRVADAPDLPRFTGGFVGYLGLACVAQVERLPVKPDPLGLPEAVLERFDTVLAYDHAKAELLLVTHADLEAFASEDLARQAAEAELDALEALVGRAGAAPLACGPAPSSPAELAGREAFEAAVGKAKAHIRNGEVFQVVLSVQDRRPFAGDPLDIYRHLRRANPSPYHFFLDLPEGTVLGASPELLLRVDQGEVELRPIAGTRPRGATAELDDALRRELLDDPKEAAEHVMLVDLGRNDVGRVAEVGSVRVAAYRDIEPYSHVMHLVSRVTGRLREDLHPVDAFFSAFPAGTVSGAPKLRALELIDELEGPGRGIYSGAVGYFDFRGNLDTCICIRSAVFRNGEVQLQAGAGIVADSIPANEFDECRHKLAPLAAALAACTGATR